MSGYSVQTFLRPPVPRATTRTLNSAGFQPNANAACSVYYTVRIQDSVSLSGGSQGYVQLMCDTNPTPTTVVCDSRNGQTGAVVIGVSLTGDFACPLVYMVPAGYYVRIVTTNVTGTPTFTLEAQTESDH